MTQWCCTAAGPVHLELLSSRPETVVVRCTYNLKPRQGGCKVDVSMAGMSVDVRQDRQVGGRASRQAGGRAGLLPPDKQRSRHRHRHRRRSDAV